MAYWKIAVPAAALYCCCIGIFAVWLNHRLGKKTVGKTKGGKIKGVEMEDLEELRAATYAVEADEEMAGRLGGLGDGGRMMSGAGLKTQYVAFPVHKDNYNDSILGATRKSAGALTPCASSYSQPRNGSSISGQAAPPPRTPQASVSALQATIASAPPVAGAAADLTPTTSALGGTLGPGGTTPAAKTKKKKKKGKSPKAASGLVQSPNSADASGVSSSLVQSPNSADASGEASSEMQKTPTSNKPITPQANSLVQSPNEDADTKSDKPMRRQLSSTVRQPAGMKSKLGSTQSTQSRSKTAPTLGDVKFDDKETPLLPTEQEYKAGGGLEIAE